MREELGSRNVSNKTVDMHSPSKISLYLHQKTILSRVLYLVRKLRSNPFQRTLFRLETISLCGDIHQILHKWETCQQFCKSLYIWSDLHRMRRQLSSHFYTGEVPHVLYILSPLSSNISTHAFSRVPLSALW